MPTSPVFNGTKVNWNSCEQLWTWQQRVRLRYPEDKSVQIQFTLLDHMCKEKVQQDKFRHRLQKIPK